MSLIVAYLPYCNSFVYLIQDRTSSLSSKPEWLFDVAIYLFGSYMLVQFFIPTLFVIKWSKEWNKKIDTQMESISKDESSSKDEVQHD